MANAHAGELTALESGLGTIELPSVAVYRLAGENPRSALHRIVTQDVEGMAPGEGRLALVLAPKGQFRALMALFRLGDDLLVVSPPGKGPDLVRSLERYLALSRCRLEPITGHVLVVSGGRWNQAVADLGIDPSPILAGGGVADAVRSEVWLASSVLGVPGALAVCPSGARRDAVRAALHSAGAVALSESSLELARIMGGMPAWGAELTDSVLPPEVGLDRTAVSGRKGCYIGQETMARIATYGHVNRILVAVREDAATAGRPVLPLALVSPSDGAAKGELTSWALHPALGGVGLAIVRRQAAEVDSVLQGGGRRLRVVRLIAG